MPLAVGALLTVTVPVAAVPGPLSSRAMAQSSTVLLAANMAAHITASMEPAPKAAAACSLSVTNVGTPAATVPAARRWPRASILKFWLPAFARLLSNSMCTPGVRRLGGIWLNPIISYCSFLAAAFFAAAGLVFTTSPSFNRRSQ